MPASPSGQESALEENLLIIPPYQPLVCSAEQPTNIPAEALWMELKQHTQFRIAANLLQQLMQLCILLKCSQGILLEHPSCCEEQVRCGFRTRRNSGKDWVYHRSWSICISKFLMQKRQAAQGALEGTLLVDSTSPNFPYGQQQLNTGKSKG